MSENGDRRRFPRLSAPLIYRPAGLDLFHHRRSTRDIGLGGARTTSDERLAPGDRLELELLMPDSTWLRVWATVAWISPADESENARFGVGLRFTDIADDDVRRLASVLTRRPEQASD